MQTDEGTFVDLSHTKKGRFRNDWFREWKAKRTDGVHKLISRFHAGDDSVIQLLAEKGIKAIRPEEKRK